jgi:hypothetical protein
MQYLMIAVVTKTDQDIRKLTLLVFFLPTEKVINKSGSNGWKESDQCDE